MHAKQFLKRGLSQLLVLAMAFSMLAGVVPMTAVTAEAKDSTDLSTTGHLYIQLMDSDVYGADEDEATNISPRDFADNGWVSKVWGEKKITEFLTTASGLARMDKRTFIVYDIGDGSSDNVQQALEKKYREKSISGAAGKCYTTSAKASTIGGQNVYIAIGCLAGGEGHNDGNHSGLWSGKVVEADTVYKDGNTYADIDFSKGDLGLQENHYYVVIEGESRIDVTKGYMPGYGYISNTATGRNLNDPSDEGWQLIFKYVGSASKPYIVSVDPGTGKWTSKDGDGGNTNIGTGDQPLHNEPARGGFKFSVKDVENGSGSHSGTQGVGDMYDAVFAVFNINSTAVGPDGSRFSNTGAGLKDKVYGYVTVDDPNRSGDKGSMSDEEMKVFYPAYDYQSVIAAYDAYLEACASGKSKVDLGSGVGSTIAYNGLYGQEPTTLGNKGAGYYFVLGDDSKPIVPCMILHPDANGVVDTGSRALPVGNYLVLQVKSGSGFYMDENFRPVVSIGTFGRRGFGNYYPTVMEYSNSDGFKSKISSSTSAKAGKSPVFYVPTQQESGSVALDLSDGYAFSFYIDNGTYTQTPMKVTDTYVVGDTRTEAYPNDLQYKINMNGAGNNTSAEKDGSWYDNTGVGSRRWPKIGMSRFTAWQAPVRAGVSIMLGDADDTKAASKSSPYVGEPQGDGTFLGTTFRVRPVDTAVGKKVLDTLLASQDTTTFTDGDKHFALFGVQYFEQEELRYDNNLDEYNEYTAVLDEDGNYFINIPVDELPYGVYAITQVLTGEGYGNDGNDGYIDVKTGYAADGSVEGENRASDYPKWSIETNEEFTVTGLVVAQENSVIPNYPHDSSEARANYKFSNSGAQYLPQTIVRGGMHITATPGETVENPDDVQVRVQVYNISKHYVYVDPAFRTNSVLPKDTGVENATMRVETSNLSWNQGVADKVYAAKTPSEMASALNSISRSCVYDTGMVKLSAIRDGLLADTFRNLPYGTYAIAVTGLTNGYSVTTPLIDVQSVNGVTDPNSNPYDDDNYKPGEKPTDENLDQLVFNVIIEDSDKVPVIKTTLLDEGYRIDSTPVKEAQGIVDQVEFSNLLKDKTYIAYSMLYDLTLNSIVPGTSVLPETVKGYVDTGHGTVDESLASNLAGLVSLGATYSTAPSRAQAGYSGWLDSVASMTSTLNDSLLPKLIVKAKEFAGMPGNDLYYKQIMSRLRYLSNVRDNAGNSLNGCAFVEFHHGGINTVPLEGHNIVGFMFLVQEDSVNPAILAATTAPEFIAAAGKNLKATEYSSFNEDQTDHIASLDISARASLTGGKEMDPTETVKAAITAGNLESGNDYLIRAWLYDEDGNKIKDSNRKDLVVERSFRANSATYTVDDVVFDGLDAAKYNGQRLTVYADLIRTVTTGSVKTPYWLVTKGDPDSLGYEAGSEEPGKNQVDVYAPVITTVFSSLRGDKTVNFDTEVALKDTVHYEQLIPGATYRSTLTVYTEDGLPAVDDNGKGITVSLEFTAETDKYDIELVTPAVSGKALQGMELIAFNDLERKVAKGYTVVAQEHDLHDRSQTIVATGTVTSIYFATTAMSDDTNSHYLPAMVGAHATDSVIIRNLAPETRFVLKTELAYASNGRVITQFDPVNTNVTSDKDGVVRVSIPLTINSEIMSGQAIVVYETLYDEGGIDVVAEHRDRADYNQTLYVSGLDTVASNEAGDSSLIEPVKTQHDDVSFTADKNSGDLTQNVKTTYTYEATVRDRVWYDNLVPGNKYDVETTVVAQKNGNVVGTMTKSFTPKTASGSFTVFIDLDVTNFVGQKLVVYETVTDSYTGEIIAYHEDIDDEDQTVTVLAPPSDQTKPDETQNPAQTQQPTDNSGKPDNTGKDIQTGVDELYGRYFLIAALLAAIAAAGGFFYYWKKRRG